jgi:two-component system sensor histidine kinase YesM
MGTPVELTPGTFFPIKWKLIVYSIIFMMLMGFIGIYVNLGLKMSSRFFKGILDEYKYLEVLGGKVHGVKFYTENFLAEDSYGNLEKCLAAQADLRDEIEYVSNYLYSADNEAKYYSYLDLAKCLGNFVDLSEKAVSTRRAGTLEIAYSYNYKMTIVSDLISKYLASLINRNANWGNERFARLSRQIKKIEYLTYALAGVIALLSITYCFIFAVGITQPLKQMVQNAEKIGEGHFLVGEVSANSADELQIIARVFNRMSRNIHDLFYEIQKKVQLERELKEEKLRNLEIENMLRETEIQVLQSQVNPHFLYNTLNAISQVAILEDAVETGELIKAVARLLRYNLQSPEQPVTISDEIAHLKEYIYIMNVRYGERIEYRIDCPDGLDRYLIPCMTFQPIIENAFIHGVAPLSGRQGRIIIQIIESGDCFQITIADNGVGITPAKLQSLLQEKPNEACSRKSPAQSSGLGMANVRKRLELFYHHANLMAVWSRPGEGTRVVLTLPILEEEEMNAQSDNR